MHARPLCVRQYMIPESCNEDAVYATHIPQGKNVEIVRRDNEMYKSNDYTLSAFSTMGTGLKLVHRNNIATAIRTYNEISSLTRRMNNDNSNRGVMIVEKFTLNIHSRVELYDVLKVYRDDPDIKFETEDLDKYIEEFRNLKISNSFRMPVTIRYGSFVSEKQIVDNGSLYIKDYDIIITSNDYYNLPKHPYSNSGDRLSHEERIKHMPANIISIDITDNSISKEHSEQNTKRGYISKSYFINIGGDVHKIVSSADGVTPDGCVLAVKSQFSETATSININDLSKLPELGIYKTYDEAKYNGDIRLKIEEKKFESELSKLENEINKANTEKDKLVLDKERLEYEKTKLSLEKLKLEYEAAMIKRKNVADYISVIYKLTGYRLDLVKYEKESRELTLKYEREKEKFKREQILAEAKFERERIMSEEKFKREQDVISSKYEYEAMLAEEKLKREKHERKAAINKQEHDLEMQKLKYKNDKVKGGLDIGTKVINGAMTIAKDVF